MGQLDHITMFHIPNISGSEIIFLRGCARHFAILSHNINAYFRLIEGILTLEGGRTDVDEGSAVSISTSRFSLSRSGSAFALMAAPVAVLVRIYGGVGTREVLEPGAAPEGVAEPGDARSSRSSTSRSRILYSRLIFVPGPMRWCP